MGDHGIDRRFSAARLAETPERDTSPVAGCEPPRRSCRWIPERHEAQRSVLHPAAVGLGGRRNHGLPRCMQQQGLFLRLPGQWEDGAWTRSTSTDLVDNVRRWYRPSLGKCLSPDPVLSEAAVRPYAYARASSLRDCCMRTSSSGVVLPTFYGSVQSAPLNQDPAVDDCCSLKDAVDSHANPARPAWCPRGPRTPSLRS